MPILIIGGGGFIGTHLTKHLLDEGHSVICVDISGEKIKPLLGHPNLEFHIMDMNESDKLRGLIKRCDCVIFLVALCNPYLYVHEPLRVFEINFTQSVKIIQMCSEEKKWLIHFSTSEVYGRNRSTLNEDTTQYILGPLKAQRWIYASAKELLERVIYAHSFERGLEYTIIRPFNFIGAGMDYLPYIDREGTPRVPACFLSAMLLNKPLLLVDGGKNQRVITDIRDAVKAIGLIVKNPKSKGQVFNIGNPNNEFTIEELAHKMTEIFSELAGVKNTFEIRSVPSSKFYGEGYEDSDRRMPDITKAREILGWEPEYDFDSTLRELIQHYLNQQRRNK